MKIISFALLAIFLASASATEEVKQFIVGGNDASEGQFPYFVSFRYGEEWAHGCGGGILNTRWIITAGHCVIGNLVGVVIGGLRIDEGTRYNLIQGAIHPDYIPTLELIGYNYSNWHDIGLVKTDREITFSDSVQPIPLARRRVIGSSVATVAGLGYTYLDRPWQNVEEAEHLQYLRTNIITNTECSIRARLYGIFEPRYTTPIIYSGHLCTLNPTGQGICFADSGSPVITRDGVVAVVVSGVLLCARGAPDVHVRVSNYLSWIDLYIHDLS